MRYAPAEFSRYILGLGSPVEEMRCGGRPEGKLSKPVSCYQREVSEVGRRQLAAAVYPGDDKRFPSAFPRCLSYASRRARDPDRQFSLAGRPKSPGIAIRIGQRIAERHDALLIKTVRKTEGMPDFMQGLLQETFPQQCRAGPEPQPVQRDHRRPAAKVRYAEDNIEIRDIEIGICYCEDAPADGPAGLIEQHVAAILAVRGRVGGGVDLLVLRNRGLDARQRKIMR